MSSVLGHWPLDGPYSFHPKRRAFPITCSPYNPPRQYHSPSPAYFLLLSALREHLVLSKIEAKPLPILNPITYPK
uniref:Uncharacterized protein n=1 Tax=Solanum tuberosum TaxID=4113 RepID=M1B8G2_SOLTU